MRSVGAGLLRLLLLAQPAFALFPPGAPTILGPVSEASTFIQVTNLVPDVLEVVVSGSTGTELARGPPVITRAGTGVVAVTLASGLIPGSDLVVKQRSGAGWSLNSPTGQVSVGKFTKPGPPTISSLVHTCISAIQVSDVLVGAEIQVFADTTLVGRVVALDSLYVWVEITPSSLSPGSVIHVTQQIDFHGLPSAGTASTDPLERYDVFISGVDTSLDIENLDACQMAIPIKGGIPGTSYSMDNMGRLFDFFSPSFDFQLLLSQPLVQDNVIFQQHFASKCERVDLPPQTFTVAAPTPPPRPTVSPPPCAKSRSLRFSGLVIGGTLVLIHTDSSGASTGFEWGNGDVPLPPDWFLADGTTTFYQVDPCGTKSPSDTVRLAGDDPNPGDIQFVTDLYECSRFVLFTGVSNAITTVLSFPDKVPLSAPSLPQQQADGLAIHTPMLWSKLARDQILFIRQDGCGGPAEMDRAAYGTVQHLPEKLASPDFDQPSISEIDVKIKVKGVLPGATVTVFLDGTPYGQAEAYTDHVTVPLEGAGFTGGIHLQPGQLVTAIQSFDCDNNGIHSSDHTSPGLVVRPASLMKESVTRGFGVGDEAVLH